MYNVYSLTEGMVDNEQSFNDFEDAVYYYGDVIHQENALRDSMPDYAETTVHLFDAHQSSMNLLAEHTIEGN